MEGPKRPVHDKNTPPMILLVEWIFYLFMKNAHLAVKEQQKKVFLINSYEHLVQSNKEFMGTYERDFFAINGLDLTPAS